MPSIEQILAMAMHNRRMMPDVGRPQLGGYGGYGTGGPEGGGYPDPTGGRGPSPFSGEGAAQPFRGGYVNYQKQDPTYSEPYRIPSRVTDLLHRMGLGADEANALIASARRGMLEFRPGGTAARGVGAYPGSVAIGDYRFDPSDPRYWLQLGGGGDRSLRATSLLNEMQERGKLRRKGLLAGKGRR